MRRLLAVMFVAIGVGVQAGIASSGLTPRPIPGYGVTVDVPSSWVGAKATGPAASIGIKYFYRAPEVISGFRVNLNLIISPLPRGMTLREWLFSGASASLQYVGTTEAVTIDGMRALHYETTKAIRYGSQPLFTDEYAFVHKGQVYLFTYTALAGTRARYENLFTASARSIRLGATA